MEGENAGDPTTVISSGAGYVYAASNLTNLYNHPNGYDYEANGQWLVTDPITNITQATRSILWLNNDYLVVYDRATSLNPGLFKRFNLSLGANPSISGSAVADTMPDGQQLFVQTLLPADAVITSFDVAADISSVADLEPMQYIMQVQDPTLPLDTRFLHVLQGANPGASMAAATYSQSTSGTAFDGAGFGSVVVYFPTSATVAFAGCTLPAPAAATAMYVTGLASNAGYTVSIQPASNGYSVTIAAGGSTMADSGGVLVIAL